MEPVRIVICGESILLGTMAVALRRLPGLDVISLSSPPLELEPLAALTPNVILFEVGAPPPQSAFTLLQNCPGLRLIGLDADRNRAVVWSARQLAELSLGDFARLLGEDQSSTLPIPDLPKDRTS